MSAFSWSGVAFSMPALARPPLVFSFTGYTKVLEFTEPGQALDLPVKVPHLSGMDELVVTNAGLSITGRYVNHHPVAVNANTASSKWDISSGRAPALSGQLQKIVFKGPDVVLGGEAELVLSPQGNSGRGLLFKKDKAPKLSTALSAKQLHLLVCLGENGNFGPPVAAAPYFAMPDNAAGMYGPALGNASLRFAEQNGVIVGTLTLVPPLDTGEVRVVLGTAQKNGPHEGLPHEIAPISWTAQDIEGIWATAPQNVTIVAGVDSGDSPADVASFPGVLPQSATAVDFTPAAHSILSKRYPDNTGDHVQLDLTLTSDVPGKAVVTDLNIAAQYRLFPFGKKQPRAVSLRGSPEGTKVKVASGLTPEAFSVTLDGKFGAARLIDACGDGTEISKTGFCLSGDTKVGLLMPLTQKERGLPLVRLGILGRVSKKTEVVARLHKGDMERIGAPLGEPVSMIIEPSTASQWLRVDIPSNSGAPPHPATVWAVLAVTQGSLWWYTRFPEETDWTDLGTFCFRSSDQGETWQKRAGRPMVQLHVNDPEPDTEEAGPLPIRLIWQGERLSDDLLKTTGVTGPLPAGFRREGVALLGARDDRSDTTLPLDDIKQAGEQIELTFSCRRDVDFNILDAVLTYNPWEA